MFQEALAGHLGTRTREMGVRVYDKLLERGAEAEKAHEWANQIAERFGACKRKTDNDPLADLEIEQLVHFSPAEQAAIDDLITQLVESKHDPNEQDLDLLRKVSIHKGLAQ